MKNQEFYLTLNASIASQADKSLWLGKFCNKNLPAFHNLLVNALLEVNLSVDKFRSCNKKDEHWTTINITIYLLIFFKLKQEC